MRSSAVREALTITKDIERLLKNLKGTQTIDTVPLKSALLLARKHLIASLGTSIAQEEEL